MVTMEVASIEVRELRELLPLSSAGDADDDEEEVKADLAPSSCLVLDCRAFLAFGAARVRGSVCVRWGALERRRSGAAGMTLERAVPCPEARARLLAGGVASLVLVDEGSPSFESLGEESTARAAALALRQHAPRVPLVFLAGGFSAFHAAYPELCRLSAAPPDLPGSPNTCTPRGGHGVTPLYDQGGPVELRPFLLLGSALHSSQHGALRTLGVTALLDVTGREAERAGPAAVMRYLSVPVADSPAADIAVWFRSAIQFIESERRRGGRVLVFCQAGVSRSATICLAYLMWRSRMRLEEAFAFLKGRRSVVSPNLGFMGQLLQFEAQLLAATPREDAGTADCGDGGGDGDDASGSTPRALPGTPVAPSSPCSVFSFSPGSLPVLSPVPPVSSC
ncbi:dual specificity protein phosphatase 1-like [Lethenteron reissneri]|uniref:dual specificity protein phosphatase 1-like n=1 Tax=Lethenteron reissneri TaxID=7753 RepID=UPI002AB6612C|nr:dual specificity protein phosphatase 1-like [Lethenteron reissneri]